MSGEYQIASFYEFKDLTSIRSLEDSRSIVRDAMMEFSVRGTVILATEGFNATLSGLGGNIERFISSFEKAFETRLAPKISLHEQMPFRKVDVKIRPEIVTLRKEVDVSLARGTHLSADEWNALLNDDDVVVLDTRNDYEYKNGTFRGAI